jgi:type IV pilus assembly protein PilA
VFYRLRQRTADEGGFTLIELLVVILIVGILSAIAIPTFLSQKGKADDAGAKTQVGTMQTAIETYSTENNGSYKGASVLELQKIEPSLKEVTDSKPTVVEGSATGYTITSESVATKDTFTIKNTAGVVERTCTGTGGGCKEGKW